MRNLRQTRYGDYERRVNFHVYGYAVYVVFTSDMARSVSERYNDTIVEKSFDALHVREKGNPYSHLFFKIGNCTNGMAAHESWHVVRFMLHDWAHCELDNETVAYHIGYLVDGVTMFRNDLVDKGVGVKSKRQEVPNERSTSQGTVGAMQGVSSRFYRETGKDMEAVGDYGPSQQDRDERSGRP